jgi:hypothetical protein
MREYCLEFLGAGLAGLAYLSLHGSGGPGWLTTLEWSLAGALTVLGIAQWLRLRRMNATDRHG